MDRNEIVTPRKEIGIPSSIRTLASQSASEVPRRNLTKLGANTSWRGNPEITGTEAIRDHQFPSGNYRVGSIKNEGNHYDLFVSSNGDWGNGYLIVLSRADIRIGVIDQKILVLDSLRWAEDIDWKVKISPGGPVLIKDVEGLGKLNRSNDDFPVFNAVWI